MGDAGQTVPVTGAAPTGWAAVTAAPGAATPRRARRRRLVAGLAAAALTTSLVACSAEEPDAAPAPTPAATSSAPAEPMVLAVHGSEAEIAAWEQVVTAWNAGDGTPVELEAAEDPAALLARLESGDVPDVFLVDREQLGALTVADPAAPEDEEPPVFTQPVDELLDERGVPFGDGYQRDALQAFSADNRLQCMPYSISAQVLFINTALVDLARMEQRELPVPNLETEDGTLPDAWDFEEFAAAARFAAKPRRGVAGLHVDASLRGLAPFVAAGGGEVFEDEEPPATTTLSSEESQEALAPLLDLLREPGTTLTPDQLAEADPVTWFERGRLGMLPGYRSLVPQLRVTQGLEFDVMPMPTGDGTATIGRVEGLCIGAGVDDAGAAADFLVHALSAEQVAGVTRAGYTVPANLEVAESEDFLQPGRQPENAGVFNRSVRAIIGLPALADFGALEAALSPGIQALLLEPVLSLDEATAALDEASRTVLDPEVADDGTASPTASMTAEPTPSP